MKHYKVLSAVICVAFFFCVAGTALAQSPASPDLSEAKRQIEMCQASFFRAFATGDSLLFANQYTDDCCILAHGSPVKCGKGAPLDFFKQLSRESGWRSGKFVTIDVFGDGSEFVTAVGFWHAYNPQSGNFDRGKFLTLYKKTSAGWKMFRDSFSSDVVN